MIVMLKEETGHIQIQHIRLSTPYLISICVSVAVQVNYAGAYEQASRVFKSIVLIKYHGSY